MKSAIYRRLALLAAMAVLSGCATLGSGTPEDQVRALAQERWNAAVAGNFEKVYSFTPPSYRAVTPYNRFRAAIGSAASVVGAEVASVECSSAESCTSRTRLDFYAAFVKDKMSTHFDERWIREDGKWWLYQR